MCSLPNFSARDLEELSQRRQKQIKKIEAETVELFIPDCKSLESSI
jgi:hypothetical protein